MWNSPRENYLLLLPPRYVQCNMYQQNLNCVNQFVLVVTISQEGNVHVCTQECSVKRRKRVLRVHVHMHMDDQHSTTQ